MKIIAIIFLLLSVISCSSSQLIKLPKMSDDQKAEILVYRKSSFNAGGTRAIFGIDGYDYVALTNKSYFKINIKPKEYKFFVRTKSFLGLVQLDSDVITLNLKNGDKKCILIIPSSYNKKRAINSAILGMDVSRNSVFNLREEPCSPEESILDGEEYKSVLISYGKK